MMLNASAPLATPFDLSGKRIWVAGHRGMVGSAIVRRLAGEDCEILTADRATVNLLRQRETEEWIAETRPHAIFLAAATVGGILANDTRPAEFLFDNLAIETHVIEAARRLGTEKLLFLGSSCIYPKLAQQPIRESELLTGPLEPTNQWYAVAKIAGIKLCQAYRRQYGLDFIAAMPTNLYGPGDNFDLASSHVVPALLRKVHEAKTDRRPTVDIWGSGTPKREFLYVEDCADGLVHIMKHYSGESHVNVGTGKDVTIRELADAISSVVGYDGEYRFDTSKPDGTPRKLLDVSRLAAIGWTAETNLKEGLRKTYEWYLSNVSANAL
jgi:GDP-L-fucose synthase